MKDRLFMVTRASAVAAALIAAGAASAAEIASPASPTAAGITPHRALYAMSLLRAGTDSGVTGARGTMAYQWGKSCDGWTIEQNYRLNMGYSESSDVAIASNFVTWESFDGLHYRFNQKETRNGADQDEIRGTATIEGAGKSGTANFEKPADKSFQLPAGVLFPSEHTIMLIDKAKAGENFMSKQVFDGSAVEAASLVSAVIGPKIEPDVDAAKKSPLLNRPGWRVRLAFFPADQKVEKPDYELGMVLLDNGISRDMVIDYGDYAISAKLDDVEVLPKPHC